MGWPHLPFSINSWLTIAIQYSYKAGHCSCLSSIDMLRYCPSSRLSHQWSSNNNTVKHREVEMLNPIDLITIIESTLVGWALTWSTLSPIIRSWCCALKLSCNTPLSNARTTHPTETSDARFSWTCVNSSSRISIEPSAGWSTPCNKKRECITTCGSGRFHAHEEVHTAAT